MNQWVYDTAGVNGWYKYLYNAAGTFQLSQAYYDRNGNIEVLAWDPAHGDVLQTDTTYAPTSTHQVTYDTAGVNGWSALISDWTASGQLVDQSWSERDGSSNTEFYSNGVLSSNVTIGAGGEKAEIVYDLTGNAAASSTDLLSDDAGRSIFTAQVMRAGLPTVTTPGEGWRAVQGSAVYFQTYTDKWGNVTPAGPLESNVSADTSGDVENREFNTNGTLKALGDHYADGSSDVTLFNITAGPLARLRPTSIAMARLPM